MKIRHVLVSCFALLCSNIAFAQANTSLSNLTAPTAINAELRPSNNALYDLGSSGFNWKNLYLSGGLNINGLKLEYVSSTGSSFLNTEGAGLSTGSSIVAIGRFTGAHLTTGSFNTLVGVQAGLQLTTGSSNIALGYLSLGNSATVQQNIAIGNSTLVSSNGYSNVAVGHSSQTVCTSGESNVSLGNGSLYSVVTGANNTAVGHVAAYNNLANDIVAIGGYSAFYNTTGQKNIAVGSNALFNNSIGNSNTVIGYNAAWFTTGNYNTALGSESLFYNTTGSNNLSLGTQALYRNTTGNENVAIGTSSLFNAVGSSNVAIGYSSLSSANSSNQNVAIGARALANGVTVTNNIAIGYESAFNTNSQDNIAIGNSSLRANTTGIKNIAIGKDCLRNLTTSSHHVAIGDSACARAVAARGLTAVGNKAGQNIVNGDYNTFVGYLADALPANPATTNSTSLGSLAIVDQSNQMSFGNVAVTKWMFGRISMTAGRALQVGSNATNGNGASLTTGGVWTNASTRTIKGDIQKLNAEEVLQKVNKLELTRWKYNGTDEYHIGPMAEEFYDLFHVGVDNVSVSTIDPAGVALVSIQALSVEINNLEKNITTLQDENEGLKEQVKQMDECLQRLCILESKMSDWQQSMDATAPKLGITPNPSKGLTTINYSISSGISATLIVHDMSGKTMKVLSLVTKEAQTAQLDTAQWPTGNYTCSLIIDDVAAAHATLVVANE